VTDQPVTDDTVIDAIGDVLNYIDAFEPMVEVLEEVGATLSAGAVGAVLLFTAVTAEIVRDRALDAYGAVRGVQNAPDSDGTEVGPQLLATARAMVRDAVEGLGRTVVDGGDVG